MFWPLTVPFPIGCAMLWVFATLAARTRAAFLRYWAFGWAFLIAQSIVGWMSGGLDPNSRTHSAALITSLSLQWIGLGFLYFGAIVISTGSEDWGLWAKCFLPLSVLLFASLQMIAPSLMLRAAMILPSVLLVIMTIELVNAHKRAPIRSLVFASIASGIWAAIPLAHAATFYASGSVSGQMFASRIAWPLFALLSTSAMIFVAIDWAN